MQTFEYKLLNYLMRHPERVHSRAQLLDKVWGPNWFGDDHVVDVHMANLRKKIDAGGPPMIHTMRGAGYVLKPAADPVRVAAVLARRRSRHR